MAPPVRTDNHSYLEITRLPPSKGYIVRLQMSLPSLPQGMNPKEHPPISTAAVFAFYNAKGKYVPEPKSDAAAKKAGIRMLPFMTVSGTDPRTVAQTALAYLSFRGVQVKQAKGNAEIISLPELLRDKKKLARPPQFTPFGNDEFFGSIRAILHASFASVLANFDGLSADQLPYALSVDVRGKDGVVKTVQSCGASVDGTGETVLRKPCIHGGPCKQSGGGTCVLFKGGVPAGKLGQPRKAAPGPTPIDAGLDDGEPMIVAAPSLPPDEPSEPALDFSTSPPPVAEKSEPDEPALDFNIG